MPHLTSIIALFKRVMKSLPPLGRILDFIQVPLLICGLFFLCFILGSTAAYFQWAPYQFVKEAIEGGKAWNEARKENTAPPERKMNVFESMQNAKTYWQRYQAYNGYTLIIPRYSAHLYLVDMQGKITHRWHVPFNKAWHNPPHIKRTVPAWRIFPESASLQPNGDVVVQYTGQTDTPYGYGIARFDKDSKLLWTYNERAHHNIFHDIQTDEFYVLLHHFRKGAIKGMEKLPRPILDDQIAIISNKGKELERISMLDAFKDTVFEQFLYHFPPVPGAAWDLFHLNSVNKLSVFDADKFPMFKPGDLLVSFRDSSTIAVIDPESKKVKWVTKGPWKFQHDVSFLNNGHILMMDNMGCYAFRKFCSRALEYDPVTGGIAWMYPSTQASPNDRFLNVVLGHTQRLPNGNTLISQPYDSRLMEVSQAGNIAWRYDVVSYEKDKKRTQPEYVLRNREKHNYPQHFLSDAREDLSNVLIFSKRYSAAELPFVFKLKK